MNIFNQIKDIVSSKCEEIDRLSGADLSRLTVEPPRDPAHGDMATNAAMVLAKAAGMKPRDLAEQIAEKLTTDDQIAAAEVAGPGFINLRLSDVCWHAVIRNVLSSGLRYGTGKAGGGQKINVEYVSANPTGPMHVGHARGAVVGDALARLLAKAGYDVTREYYINDAGAQVISVARALRLRYLVATGAIAQADFDAALEAKDIEYGGEYLAEAADKLVAEAGKDLDEGPEKLDIFREHAVRLMMDMVREDLATLGVHHDVFTSEKALVDAGKVADAVAFLDAKGLMYTGVLEPPKGKKPDDWEERPQRLFRATEFGDDVDRPLQKSDGSWTYFASDIAYHRDKIDRGFNHMVNVWGADHGGYVKRMEAAVRALTDGKGSLEVRLCQMVKLTKNGEPVRMSKRAGNFVTLRDLIDEVGADVVRFIMLTRKSDAQLDFDFARVLDQTRENPVFYVHYAYARGNSVFRVAAETFPDADFSEAALAQADLSALSDPDEIKLVRDLAAWPRTVDAAALAREPHRVAYYLYDIASGFHALWNKGNDDASLRFVLPEDLAATTARLALVKAVGTVIASGLDVFGVVPREEMR